MLSLTRRAALKILTTGTAILAIPLRKSGLLNAAQATSATTAETNSETFQSNWANTRDRVWIGGELWSNPMEDWCIRDGALECLSRGGARNVQHLTHQLTDPTQPFQMAVTVERIGPEESEENQPRRSPHGVGFRVGVRSDINEHRANCFAGNGLQVGVRGNALVIGSNSNAVPELESHDSYRLELAAEPAEKQVKLTLTVKSAASGEELGRLTQTVAGDTLLGNVAVASNFDVGPGRRDGDRYRFRDWSVSGKAFTVDQDHRFGPILWTMYTLSDSRSDDGFVLKLSALTGPLSTEDEQNVELQFKREGKWESAGEQTLDTDGWVATFRIPNWDETKSVPYRVLYRERLRNDETAEHEWSGTIRPNPTGRPLRFGALTCQNDYAFPYEPVAENLIKLDPDIIYFSGDQLYENHGGFGVVRDDAERAILNYLRKFYQFGWSFRNAMKDRPTVCIPDDHDVFQGNLWGESGAAMDGTDTSTNGGYRQPARMVNAVHRTCVGHHPDFGDREPVQQEISVYHGDLVYGDVSFAIIADRQFKSGPGRVDTGSGRADHLSDPDIDPATLDVPGLVLLGERQEQFLKDWAEDWRGHSLKVLLSQTVFAGVATHHGAYDDFLRADLDCGGWPQTPRNRTIEILREAKPLHINGDQHLTSLVQYGVDQQRDGNWSFCSPAIAVGYPRWWRPDEMGMPHENRPQHGLANTGEYLDGLGNKVYVYAIGNPEVESAKHRYERAHEKGSGLGLVIIDPKEKTYEIHSYRFLIDVNEDNPNNEFPGWPVTIHQDENAGENRIR